MLAQAVLKVTILLQLSRGCDYKPVSSLLSIFYLFLFLLLKPFSNLPVRQNELHICYKLYLLK